MDSLGGSCSSGFLQVGSSRWVPPGRFLQVVSLCGSCSGGFLQGRVVRVALQPLRVEGITVVPGGTVGQEGLRAGQGRPRGTTKGDTCSHQSHCPHTTTWLGRAEPQVEGGRPSPPPSTGIHQIPPSTDSTVPPSPSHQPTSSCHSLARGDSHVVVCDAAFEAGLTICQKSHN